MPALRNGGINIGSHIEKCCGIEDPGFSKDPVKTIELLKTKSFPTISDEAGEKMIKAIEDAKNEQDSVGGIIETCITGLPAGLGEPWFDSFEGILSHIVFSLGGVKGIEFGKGFEAAGMKGSEFNDPFVINDGKIKTTTNNNGGINGGITNGMDVLFRVAVKPTPSISKEQDTVNFLTNEAEKLVIKGRHDPAIVRRICPVIDAVAALAVADLLTVRFGTDALLEGSRLWNTD
jgi:chorismate synthase